MELFNLNTLLFAGKWAFIGLVYLILIIVIVAVRREMASHTPGRQPAEQIAPGRVRILSSGSDPVNLPGTMLNLMPHSRMGAAVDNDIVLSDQFVSAYHARLNWDGSAWWVEDLGSANGTKVNESPCPRHVPQPVPPGARLAIGDMVLEIVVG